MRDSRRLIGLMIVAVIFVPLLAMGWILGRAAFRPTIVSAQSQGVLLVATPENLKDLGLSFQPVDPASSTAQGAIAESAAVAVALKAMPNLSTATGYSAGLGTLNDPGLQQAEQSGISTDPELSTASLVWAIVFHGIQSVSSGPAGAPHHYASDYVVVVDAKTGAYIVGFPIANVASPSVP